jgi:hypothetical protein
LLTELLWVHKNKNKRFTSGCGLNTTLCLLSVAYSGGSKAEIEGRRKGQRRLRFNGARATSRDTTTQGSIGIMVFQMVYVGVSTPGGPWTDE